MVDLEVVAHHTDAAKCLWTVADDVEVAQGARQAAVLDEIAGLHKESEVACAYLHLAVGEGLGIDAAFHAANDVLLLCLARQHIGGAHSGNGHTAETLASAVACRLDTEMSGADTVVQVAIEAAMLDKGRALSRDALVVMAQHPCIA